MASMSTSSACTAVKGFKRSQRSGFTARSRTQVARRQSCRVVCLAQPTKSAAPSAGFDAFSASVAEECVLEIPDLKDYLEARPSPFADDNNRGGGFIGDSDVVLLHAIKFQDANSAGFSRTDQQDVVHTPPWGVRAGPRATIYHDPSTVSAAVVTCGGLCPGLNDVIQNIVYTLQQHGVPEENIIGIRYGLRGFYAKDNKPIVLTSQRVEGIHLLGGTILGTSRGGADIEEIVHRIDLWGLNHVYVIGGNGGNAAAQAIHECCVRRGVVCNVIGVPKSIDNDILLIDSCFGFETAVAEAQRALMAAKVEARSAYRGVGLVNVMGRQSGFIAMNASMASGVVDVVLIPEMQFGLEKLFAQVARKIEDQGHCVVCVAEGAGQNLIQNAGTVGKDASGNPILMDIGLYLNKALKAHFKQAGDPIDLKFIDPTYMIRAIPTVPSDRIYCKILGQSSVHAAFAGFTGITTGLVNTHYVYLPIPVVIAKPNIVNIYGRKWNRLKASIDQPELI